MDLFYRIKGEGAPLIMLHGLFGSGDNLGGIARILQEDYQTIIPDLRNHGRSPHDSKMDYPSMAADVFRVMDRENIATAYVFGHSMGGKIAMQMALLSPERVKKLVVADIAPVAYSRHHDSIIEGLQKAAGDAPEGRAKAGAILAKYEDNPDVLSFLLTNWRKQEEGAWGWRMNVDVIEHDYANIIAGLTGKPFEGDVLFLRGSHSEYILPEHKEVTSQLFPQASMRTIQGTGHWLHAEKPDMVARAVNRFLSTED